MNRNVAVPSGAAIDVVTFSEQCRFGWIQNINTSASDVRLSMDGGAANGGTDPTATLGFLLPVGMQIWFPQITGTNMVGRFPPHKLVRAFGVSNTATLSVGTDDLTTQ